ncbi:MAG: family 10 glycosylhydrolase [Gemmatimonadota bacterium]|nr:family 10 glycosylhydrolase [Gemmatimonadota bacterium]
MRPSSHPRPLLALLAPLIAIVSPATLRAQPLPSAPLAISLTPPPIAREFRGAWVASVANIDWPSRRDLSPDEQRAELLRIFDRAVALRLNAIILQVRPAADALYPSRLEPWSEYLTGKMGAGPVPPYDPLAFAVQEAHARGLELHAWFNPYRARHSSGVGEPSPSHVSRRHPERVRQYGHFLWMDPGDPTVREDALRVVRDVVRRYDVDGIHIDDYFYPYQERDAAGRAIDFPDERSWRRYRRHRKHHLSRDDWRRRNVDLFVQQLYRTVHATKPWVRVGVSPFGIWRPGNPPGVAGLDAYTELYADSRRWVRQGWLDYVAPQLYWPIAAPSQPFSSLLSWWVAQNTHHRHLWPGLNASRIESGNARSWKSEEILGEIDLTRAQSGATGNILYSMSVLMLDRDSIDERLTSTAYLHPALVPASPWLGARRPRPPRIRVRDDSVGTGAEVTLSPVAGEKRSLWTVRARFGDGWSQEIVPAAERTHPVIGPPGIAPDMVVVSVIGRTGVESPVVIAVRRRCEAPSGGCWDKR